MPARCRPSTVSTQPDKTLALKHAAISAIHLDLMDPDAIKFSHAVKPAIVPEPPLGASGHCDGIPICWWEWSRGDHSARPERAARVAIGPGAQSLRAARDGWL